MTRPARNRYRARPISIPSNLLGFPLSSLSDKINKKNKQESVCNCIQERKKKKRMKRRKLYNKTFCGVTGGVICGSAALSQSSCVPKSGHFGASTEKKKRRRRRRKKEIHSNKEETSKTLFTVHLHKTF